MKYDESMVEFILSTVGKLDIYKMFNIVKDKFGYRGERESFKKYVSKLQKQKHLHVEESVEERFLKLLKKEKVLKYDTIKETLNLDDKGLNDIVQMYKTKGYDIVSDLGRLILSFDGTSNGRHLETLSNDREIIFGIASDLHFGSKACQITALHQFAEICKKKGIKHILCPGDVVAGFGVYPGQMFDVYGLSAEEQENSVIANLPRGFEWYMLGGNHDYSFIKKGGGHNPLLVIESMRDDVHYIGYDQETVPLLQNVDSILWHPTGAIPYSISYRIQKGIEQIAFAELTKISNDVKNHQTVKFVFAGHLHIEFQSMFGPIMGIQCGAFEGQTNFLKKKGIFPTVGGWTVEVTLDSDNFFKDFDARFHQQREIIDDWKNYSHDVSRPKVINPILTV
jgi:UDP-2,3-diacylglucosamine pyrophosphatase LpxH